MSIHVSGFVSPREELRLAAPRVAEDHVKAQLRTGSEAPVGRASKRQRARWWATALALACALVLHWTMLLFHNLPPNPITNFLRPTINAYVVPLWVQSWWMFAPEPISSDRVVYVRGTYLDGSRSETTDWVDLNGPMIGAIQANRLSSHAASAHVLLKALDDVTAAPALRDESSGGRERLIEDWAELSRQPAGLVVLHVAGSAALAAAFPDRQFEEVQLLLVIRRIPSFWERRTAGPSGPADELLFKPVPFQPSAPWRRP